jgi:hypothetical protein
LKIRKICMPPACFYNRKRGPIKICDSVTERRHYDLTTWWSSAKKGGRVSVRLYSPPPPTICNLIPKQFSIQTVNDLRPRNCSALSTISPSMLARDYSARSPNRCTGASMPLLAWLALLDLLRSTLSSPIPFYKLLDSLAREPGLRSLLLFGDASQSIPILILASKRSNWCVCHAARLSLV